MSIMTTATDGGCAVRPSVVKAAVDDKLTRILCHLDTMFVDDSTIDFGPRD